MNATELSSTCPEINFREPCNSFIPSFSIGDYILESLPITFNIIKSSSSIENNTIVEFVRADLTDRHLPLSENDLVLYLNCSVKYAKRFYRAESAFFALSFKPQEYKFLNLREFVPFVVDDKTKFRARGYGMVEKVFEGSEAFARKTISDLYDGYEVMMEIKVMKLAADTGNPHLVHLRCVYKQGDDTCLVMYPWCELNLSVFLNIAHKLPQWTQRSPKEKLILLTDWMACLASGLSALHQKKIRHQDLKPENVLLDDNFLPVISDFGLRHMDSEAVKYQNSLAYLSPEQLDGVVKKMGDIFSLGLIFLELGLLFFGQKCLKEEFTSGLYSEITKSLDSFFAMKFPISNHSIMDDWIKRFQSLIQSMLHVTPENRPKASKVWENVKGMVECLGAKPHCGDALIPCEPSAWEDDEEISLRVNLAKLVI